MDFVDLDKVLDDFESNEGTDFSPTGLQKLASAPPEQMASDESSDLPKYNLHRDPLPAGTDFKQEFPGCVLSHKVEYEPPDALDLSEADFGPSLPIASGEDGGYFIPEESNEYTIGFNSQRQKVPMLDDAIRRDSLDNNSEFHQQSSLEYNRTDLGDANMDSDGNDSDQEPNGTVSFLSSSPQMGDVSPAILSMVIAPPLAELPQAINQEAQCDSGVSISTSEQGEAPVLAEQNGVAPEAINSDKTSPVDATSLITQTNEMPSHQPELEGNSVSNSEESAIYDVSDKTFSENMQSKPMQDHDTAENAVVKSEYEETVSHKVEQPASVLSTTDIEVSVSSSDDNKMVAFESSEAVDMEAEDMPTPTLPNDTSLMEELQAMGELSSSVVTDSLSSDQSSSIGIEDKAIDPVEDVVSIDVSEKLSEKELELSLSDMADPSIEISSGLPDELQQALDSVTITNNLNDSAIESPLPNASEDTDNIKEATDRDPHDIEKDEESTTTVTSDDISDLRGDTHQQPASDSGDSGGENIEKFLNPMIGSPKITTPMEDSGFSKIPGYVPELSTMCEEEPNIKDETEKLYSQPNASGVPNNEIKLDIKEIEAVKKGMETSQPDSESKQSETLDMNSIYDITKSQNQDTLNDTSAMSSNAPSLTAPESHKPDVDEKKKLVLSTTTPSSPGLGARPKELPMVMTGTKKNRPNSLLGLSTPDLKGPSPVVVYPPQKGANIPSGTNSISNQADINSSNDIINMQLAAQKSKSPLTKKQLNLEIQQQIGTNPQINGYEFTPPLSDVPVSPSAQQQQLPSPGFMLAQPRPKSLGLPQNGDAGLANTDSMSSTVGPPSHSEMAFSIDAGQQGGLIPPVARPQRRPNSLNLSFNQEAFQPGQSAISPMADSSGGASPAEDLMPSVDQDGAGAQTPQLEESESGMQHQPEEAAAASSPLYSSPEPRALTPPTSSNINLAITQLGKVAPVWLPDAEAPACMQCEAKFTFTKRRHHCRACGKVFCSSCCSLKTKLQYLESKDARVCSKCYQDLIRAQYYERAHGPAQSPNPNNPSEYCSTVPPQQQAQDSVNSPPPSVMVPVSNVPGVLRKGERRKSEPKQVMFSDGIRPGGDLTELDGPAQARLPAQRPGRKAKKVIEKTAADDKSSPVRKVVKSSETSRSVCLIPEDGLPPVILTTGVKGDYSIEENPQSEQIISQIKDEEDPAPVVFAVNKNLFVLVKIVNLNCCVNRVCWCFTTKGMCTVGQDEIMVVLECLPDEKEVPRDLFCHFSTVYEEASRGNTVSHLGHTIFSQGILGSRDHGGFLYIKPSFQCTHKLLMPSAPYIFGILLQKWETPWAKVFPIRLMLRLGAEFRYYPCPLISVRFRKPVFGEIGHTIMNLLADFRNYQYMLPQVRGVAVHMEDKRTTINFPKNRYEDVIKVISNSNDHVMGLGANFSPAADSHLVCIQNEDGNYQTQAINIQNKPRKVTGASFVVFNGALKTSSGLRAKSSIVEDGLMIQITAEAMVALKQSLKDMKDYSIGCGSQEVPEPEELVVIQWVEDDKNVNVGVTSPIDGSPMDGKESIHIHNATDYIGSTRTIRWTELFFIQTEGQNSRVEPVDTSRLAETLASACCLALTPHLDKLKEASHTKIGLRVTIDRDQVGYEIGACNEKLPDVYMNELDSGLIPVIHNAASQSQEAPVILELIFHVLE